MHKRGRIDKKKQEKEETKPVSKVGRKIKSMFNFYK